MTEQSEERETRLKRLRFRSWHRGTREMDLLLGRFADAHLAELTLEELDLYEAVLRCADQDLYEWITTERPWPKALDNSVTRRLSEFTLKPAQR